MPLVTLLFALSTTLLPAARAQERAAPSDEDELFAPDPVPEGAPRVTLTDLSKIRGRPSLGDYYLREPLYAQLPEAFVADIIATSDERKWPDAVDSVARRKSKKSPLRGYPAYQVATLPGDLVVLWMPAEDPPYPPEQTPPWDFFVVVSADAVVPAKGARPVPAGPMRGEAPADQPAPATDTPAMDVAPAEVQPVASARFAEQLDTLIRALPEDFVSVRGKERPGSGGGTFGLPQPTRYDVPAGLEGASDIYVSSYGPGHAELVAELGRFASSADADAAYARLVAEVDQARLACCALVKSEMVSEISVTTSYLPFDPTRKMAPGLAGMVLDLEFLKAFSKLASGEYGYEYTVTLRIHKQ